MSEKQKPAPFEAAAEAMQGEDFDPREAVGLWAREVRRQERAAQIVAEAMSNLSAALGEIGYSLEDVLGVDPPPEEPPV